MYTRVENRFWQDEKMRTVSSDARYLMLYLLTSPHRNILGFYFLPSPYACFDLGWDEKRFSKGLQELISASLIKYDAHAHVVLIKNYLKHNPLENPNQVKSAIEKLDEIPETPLFQDFWELVNKFDKPFYKPLLERLGERLRKQGTGTGTGTGTGKDNINMCASANAECVIDTSAEKPSDTTEDGGAQQKERVKTASAGKGEDYTPEFEQFWAIYPRKVEKKKAFRVWNTRLKEKISPHDMITAARNYAAYCKKQSIEARYIKHPGTFLGPDKPFTDFIKEVVIDGTSERSFSTNDETKPDPRDKLFARTLD
ncbi:hypothetical protein [Thermoanaerobacterium sp. DL9XJH110]|uniref:hypothetical protein n=1 Tax=Thermoanaerobacterium sp. DL9XJH110 TaxID=3386643 RepID=UPI003BB4BDC3